MKKIAPSCFIIQRAGKMMVDRLLFCGWKSGYNAADDDIHCRATEIAAELKRQASVPLQLNFEDKFL